MLYDIPKVTKVIFSASVTNTTIKLNVFYSTDSAATTVNGTRPDQSTTTSGTWINVMSEQTLTTTMTDYNINVDPTGSF
jgi:hypothetical protein